MESITENTVNLPHFCVEALFYMDYFRRQSTWVACCFLCSWSHVFACIHSGVFGEVWIFYRSYWGHRVDLCPQSRCRKMYRGERKQFPGWIGLGMDLTGLCTSLVNRQLIGSFKPKLSFWPQWCRYFTFKKYHF